MSIFNSDLTFSCVNKHGNVCEIWVMKDYGVKESWVKQFVFQRLDHWSLFMPVLQLDENKILVTSIFGRTLWVGDIKSGLCDLIKVLGKSSFELVTCNSNFSKLQKFSRK